MPIATFLLVVDAAPEPVDCNRHWLAIFDLGLGDARVGSSNAAFVLRTEGALRPVRGYEDESSNSNNHQRGRKCRRGGAVRRCCQENGGAMFFLSTFSSAPRAVARS
jgi:hypothetical protein